MISAQHRPEDVSKWMKAGRIVTQMPDTTPYLDSFAKDWKGWWTSLLPDDHNPDDVGDHEVSDYSELHKAGPNGLFLHILSLVWWGAGAVDQGETKMHIWRTAVEEFTVVVKFLNGSSKAERKRTRDNSPDTSSSKKPKCV